MRLLKWFFMLSKRLYKKPSFVAILLLIPLCIFAFSFAAGGNSGFVSITLAQKNKNDEISTSVINELLQSNSIIKFTVSDSAEAAVDAVKNGGADEAWIFPEDTAAALDNYIDDSHNYVVSVFTREETSALRLSREKLTSKLYEFCARSYYIDYVRAHVSELDFMSEGELITYFKEAGADETLFAMGNPSDLSQSGGEPNYLTSPIRGLLAILAVLCGMAATMYFMQDDAAGTFSYVKQSRRGLAALACVATAVINVAVVLLLSLMLSRLATDLVREVAILLLYTLCCSAFCLLLRRIFVSIGAYAAVIPLFTVVFIGICPVFFDFRSMAPLQLLFPPTYYVNAVYDNSYLLYMAIYSVACLCICTVLKSLRIIKRK